MSRRRRKTTMERILPIIVLIMVLVLVLSLVAQTCAPATVVAPGA